MFDTNISEAILHNDFLVDFSNKRLHPQHLHSPKVIASLPQKKLGLKRPKRKFHQTQTMENLWGGEALADIGTRW